METGRRSLIAISVMLAVCLPLASLQAAPIQHDAEHYVLLHQYKDKWAAEDQELDQKLAEIRQKNGGKKPNIVHILVDDRRFGEFGIPELNKIRGGRTPNIDKLAQEGITFTRFYREWTPKNSRDAMRDVDAAWLCH